VNTEITDKKKFEGWVFFDAECRFCVRLAQRFERSLARRRFALLPLQTPWVRACLGLADSELLAEMRLLKPGGKIFGGADALLEIARHFWWTRPLRLMSRIPAVMPSFRAGYRWIARHRTCTAGACEVTNLAVGERVHLFDYLPLLVLPLAALIFRTRLASWVFMWAMAFALYAGCKWLTYRAAVRAARSPGLTRVLGYLVAWPGMNAAEFFTGNSHPAKPRRREWVFAAVKTGFGAILLWGTARLVLPAHPMLAGWIGMTGVVFMLHFGLFHLASLAWRRNGVTATPLMQNPLRAKSLAGFWGRRWNTAFNELAFRFTFRPLCRLTTPAIATVLVFGVSGLVHELVISLPARGGYGLPTIYFLIQGLGILTERSRLGRSFGLERGGRGWIFTMLVTAGPAIWLFHPPFIKNVILPMLTAIGAT
jgi:predicted DCC family thiol-disulfide oxidoreductase YuxK